MGFFPINRRTLNIELESQPFATKEQCDIFRVWHHVEDNEKVCSYLLTPHKAGSSMCGTSASCLYINVVGISTWRRVSPPD
jgi:hypothetical protein